MGAPARIRAIVDSMKQINFNVGGTPTDVPTISNDTPISMDGVFEGDPPNRCVFKLHGSMNGQGYLKWQGHSIRFLLPADGFFGEADQLGLPPIVYAPIEPSRLTIGADQFYRDGQRWVWKGITAFRLLERVLRGEDIRPTVSQYQDAGLNLVRVLGMKDNNTGWFLNPKIAGYVDARERLFDQLADVEMFCEFVAFADTRTIMPAVHDQQAFWAGSVDRCQRRPRVVVELLNEYGHPTQSINPLNFARPTNGLLAAHGSGLSDVHPVEPSWDYDTYHGRRDPPPDARGFTCYDHYEFEAGYPAQRPRVGEEHLKPSGFGYDVRWANLLGRHAGIGNGGTFHPDGGIDARLMTEPEFNCAVAFARGCDGDII